MARTTTVRAVTEYVTAREIAAMLQVSRQRLDVLSKTDPNFPAPVGVPGGVRLWKRAEIERWIAERIPDRRRRPK